MMLEQRLHDVPAARQLWDDLDFAKSQVVRLMFCLFERDRWRPGSKDGRKLMLGVFCLLPDNKIVEDVHGVIRRESAGNANSKLTRTLIQDVVIRSNVFESRGISHPATVRRDMFSRKFKQLKFKSVARTRQCTKHKMARRWTAFWGNRSWKPLTEEGNHKCQAAWQWLQTRAAATSIASALFSKLVLPYVLVKRSSDSVVLASIGNAS